MGGGGEGEGGGDMQVCLYRCPHVLAEVLFSYIYLSEYKFIFRDNFYFTYMYIIVCLRLTLLQL